MRIGIIGAGAMGLAAAWRRIQSGDQVAVLEQAAEIGGLASSFDVAQSGTPIYLEKFYHHIFQTDRDMIRWIDAMGLSTDLLWGTPPTCTLIAGKSYRMDSVFADRGASWKALAGTHLDTALALLHFAPLSFGERIRFGAMGARLKLAPDHKPFAGKTAAEWARAALGDSAFEKVLLPLLRGKFGDRYQEIAMSWLWSRFHERTQKLGYLRGGFHRLYAAIAQKIESAGGRIECGARIERIRTRSGEVVVVFGDGRSERFDRVLVTVPTPIFLAMAADELPGDYITRYGSHRAVEYLGAHCLALSLNQRFGNAYWLNVNDPGYPFLALIEHTNFLPPEDYQGQHLLYVGNYLPQDDPILSESADTILTKFTPYLQRINPAFARDWVGRIWSWGAKNAQPIVTHDYPERLPPHETPLPGVYLANMAHVYPQDRGQNYSLRIGEMVASML